MPRLPRGLQPEDEQTHAPPGEPGGPLFGDTFWLSVVDIEAGVFGINHIHLTNQGFGRFTALYVVDGQHQLYGNKQAFDLADGGARAFGDGVMRYEVLEPFETVRVTFDGPKFGFELDYRARFDAFDYHDCVRGDPLAAVGRVSPVHGGHYEQAMQVTGSFEVRAGPRAGDVRDIRSWAHRDHSWSGRFALDTPWEDGPAEDVPGHFWPSIQLPDRHINGFGVADPAVLGAPPGPPPVGGWIADHRRARAVLDIRRDPPTGDLRNQDCVRYALTTPDGETQHVRSTRCYGQVKLWCRAENDLENRLDCYECFMSFEVEETGEQGYGVAEYSVLPPRPRWLV